MTLPASDLMMATLPILFTPQLARAVTHYRDDMGFEVVQHVTGVVALLRLGDVTIYLWQQGSGDLAAEPAKFKSGLHRVSVGCAFKVYTQAMEALKIRCVTKLTGTQRPELHRLSGPPQLQSWGAWEFSITDGDANVLHFVQWVAADLVKVGESFMTQREPKSWSAPAQKLKPARRG